MSIKIKKRTILAVIDIIFVIVIVFLLAKMGSIAQEIKGIREQSISSLSIDPERVKAELQKIKPDENKLLAVFPSELALIDFVGQVDTIKKDKILQTFSFKEDTPIKDKTNYLGFPILFGFSGTISDINTSLEKVNSLPYIIRPIDVKLTLSSTASGSATLDYGGFLYVDENFGKN